MTDAPLLETRNLKVTLPTRRSSVEIVSGVDLAVHPGETLGIVGESGSGKSMTMLATIGLPPSGARVTGSVRLRDRELVGQSQSRLARLRGKEIAMIFQDPLSALNPVLTIGNQLGESLRLHHRSMSRRAVRERSLDLLDLVAIPDPVRRLNQYPHEFSGGMRQRAMIAMAVANDPAVLIADEPTTALDVTVQAQILDVLAQMRERLGLALVIITHNLGIVAGAADRVAVMYSGRIVEEGMADDIFATPAHPYTQGLLAAVPRIDRGSARLVPIKGAPPSLSARPPGCAFAPRCPIAEDICHRVRPELRIVGATGAACHLAVPVEAPE